jgi:hypothetical protein
MLAVRGSRDNGRKGPQRCPNCTEYLPQPHVESFPTWVNCPR